MIKFLSSLPGYLLCGFRQPDPAKYSPCFIGTLSAIALFGSFVLVFFRSDLLIKSASELTFFGKILFAFWVIMPPMFFWMEWVYIAQYYDKEKRECYNRTVELSKNVWLALVASLAILLKIVVPC